MHLRIWLANVPSRHGFSFVAAKSYIKRNKLSLHQFTHEISALGELKSVRTFLDGVEKPFLHELSARIIGQFQSVGACAGKRQYRWRL